jgi:hypothetical protein
VFAHGGGVQSTAALVLQAERKIDWFTHVFANVGNDSENPDTLNYLRWVSSLYAKENLIELAEVGRVTRAGKRETLYTKLMEPTSRSIPIPVRMAEDGAPGTRNCTKTFKLDVIKRLKPEVIAIGFSADEMERVGRVDDGIPRVYPLIELGVTRADCYQLIAKAGLPQPPKSSCWFCPFTPLGRWSERRRDDPELFERAAALEDTLNERRDRLGKDHVYLSRKGRPLREAITEAQPSLFDAGPSSDTCDDGVCFV